MKLGSKHTLEARRKISEARQGTKHSLETRQKISESEWGKKLSLETRQKMSKAQRNVDRRGEKHPHWKGGRKRRNDYTLLLKPNHPNADVNGYIPEHRFVMSEVLGRPLSLGETIHHINGDRRDNRKENLMLFPSNAEHMKFHGRR